MSQLFASGGESIGALASASVLPMTIQGWFPLGWAGLISLQSKGLSRAFSNTRVQKHQFFTLDSKNGPALGSSCGNTGSCHWGGDASSSPWSWQLWAANWETQPLTSFDHTGRSTWEKFLFFVQKISKLSNSFSGSKTLQVFWQPFCHSLSLSPFFFFFNGEILSPPYYWCLWYLTELDKVGVPKKGMWKERGKAVTERERKRRENRERKLQREPLTGRQGEVEEKRQGDERERKRRSSPSYLFLINLQDTEP